MNKKIFIWALLLLSLVACEDRPQQPKKPKHIVDMRITKLLKTDEFRDGSIIQVDYKHGQLKVPAQYYKTSSEGNSYGLLELYMHWPSLEGWRSVPGASFFDREAIAIFMMFDVDNNRVTKFRRKETYNDFKHRLDKKELDYKGESTDFKGLDEYWDRDESYLSSNMYYVVIDEQIKTPDGKPVVFDCRRLVREGTDKAKRGCTFSWILDGSRHITVAIGLEILEDWPRFIEEMQYFLQNIKVEEK